MFLNALLFQLSAGAQETGFLFVMSGSHISLPALDIEREQKEIDSLIASLKQYKPATKNANKDCNSSASAAVTPKSNTSRTVRGRAAKSRENHSSPVVPDTDSSLSANSFELIIDYLTRLNSQNQKLLNRVTELDAIVIEQNKNIDILKTKIDSRVEKDHSPGENFSPAPASEIFSTVVKRVEKIEKSINSPLLLCRGPAVGGKIDSSTVNGVVDLDKVKAEICAEVCGETVSRISVSALGISIYGKRKKTLKIECASVSVRNHLLEQARKRKPVGIYLVEFLSQEKLSLYQRVNDLKKEFPNKVNAVYIRKGDIFCKTEPNGDVIRVIEDEYVDDLRRQFGDRPAAAAAADGAPVAE